MQTRQERNVKVYQKVEELNKKYALDQENHPHQENQKTLSAVDPTFFSNQKETKNEKTALQRKKNYSLFIQILLFLIALIAFIIAIYYIVKKA